MVSQPKAHITPEEYLAREREADFKSEYLDGDIYNMSGGSPEHSTITVNLTGELRAQLKGKACQVFSNDMKVRAGTGRLYAYPDLSVVCGTPRYHDERADVLLNPKVIFEILSPSTELFDRVKKFDRYQQIETLTDYVLISQDKPRVEHYARQQNNRWLLEINIGLDAVMDLSSIDCTLALVEIYDRIEFKPEEEEMEEETEPSG